MVRHVDPLEPDLGSIAAIGGAVATAALFFTPAGRSLFSSVFKGVGKTAKGAIGAGLTASRVAYRTFSPWAKAPALGRLAVGGARGGARAGWGLAKMAGRVGSFASKHPTALTTVGLVGAGMYGGISGASAFVPTGPNVAYDYVNHGLSPDHLGATGDLAFALHRGR